MYCTKRTIIAERLPSDIPNKLRVEVKGKRRNILRKVKSYIEIELNPSKRKLYDPARIISKKQVVFKIYLFHFKSQHLIMKLYYLSQMIII